MHLIVPCIISAFVLTYFLVPLIIGMSHKRHLFAHASERSSHRDDISALGGVAIFIGILLPMVLTWSWLSFAELPYLLVTMAVVFVIGLRDDIVPVSPFSKLMGQSLAVLLLLTQTDIHLSELHGLFGMHKAPPLLLYLLTALFMLFLTNAFNLIDGIDGLAGSVGALVLATYGCWFWVTQQIPYALLAFVALGTLLAFLRYNYTPARIFMGDSGALIVGWISSILTIRFLEVPGQANTFHFDQPLAIAAGLLVIPTFDTLRVFFTRIYRRQHPLKADRRHIHHMLLDLGYSHMQATTLLIAINIASFTLVLSLEKHLDMHWILTILLGAATLGTYALHRKRYQRQLNHP